MKKSKGKCGLKCILLFLVGACVYYNVEICFRGHSHWTMAVLGGILFIIIGNINEKGAASRRIPLLAQGFSFLILITAFELAAGVVLNIWLDSIFGTIPIYLLIFLGKYACASVLSGLQSGLLLSCLTII